MGSGIELLTIAIGSSGAVTALIRSLPTLLKACGRRPRWSSRSPTAAM